MNREIEFRGYNPKNGKWLYGYYLVNRGKHYIVPAGIQPPSATPEDFEAEPESIGQYTGLKDRDGKRIYEDDILRVYDGERYFNIVVKWSEEAMAFMACYCDGDQSPLSWFSNLLSRTYEIEVIGNIHDNPDLLLEKRQNKGVALFGYPYLYQNGDLGFHEEMSKIGLNRGDAILGGLPNKCILANKHEYFLVDYYKEEDFCEQYKLKATYSVDDFIQGIKELKGEIK